MALDQAKWTGEVIWWSMALILLILGMGVAILLLKQKSSRKDKDDKPELLYSLHDLRGMLRKGEITREEFEKLKEVVNTQTRKTGPLGK